MEKHPVLHVMRNWGIDFQPQGSILPPLNFCGEINMTDIITLTAPENAFEIDYDGVSRWVNAELAEQFALEDEQHQRDVDWETEMNAPIMERIDALGLSADMFDSVRHVERINEKFAREIENHQRDVEFGVLKQPLPVKTGAGNKQTRHPPYSNGGPKLTTDYVTGDVALDVDGSHKVDRATIGQYFTMNSGNNLVRPACTLISGPTVVSAWGVFIFSHVWLDITVNTFNITQNTRWKKTRNKYHYKNWYAGNIGSDPVPFALYGDGYGNAAVNDKLLITVTVTARASAPLGGAVLKYRGKLTEISIDH